MKVLNFSALEILPKLLSKEKIQTIRPAFFTEFKCFYCDKKFKDIQKHQKEHPDVALRSYHFQTKPARFKVGERVQVHWKSRTAPKDALFHDVCGDTIYFKLQTSQIYDRSIGCHTCGNLRDFTSETFYTKEQEEYLQSISFRKKLGEADIVMVFKITMAREIDNGYFIKYEDGTIREPWDYDCKVLALSDGFNSVEEFFKWFDNTYDLSNPKTFWVYRYLWVK